MTPPEWTIVISRTETRRIPIRAYTEAEARAILKQKQSQGSAALKSGRGDTPTYGPWDIDEVKAPAG